ncbi:MAG TPA: precorrin-6Y C5,15-methyltransferase (decarboxylating) subunit CbiT [Arachnia sp.]|nr:precorrin-6Y C5,15-methyltransferase (decarboxylating) subunit CbiT [Arachnia sp.]HMT87269.1 precorrin-6Y C5,15-methyltransferase (decarboxylating) subunit CbiT [Arachnia sp.]
MIVDRDGALLGRAPGLPDEVFESDGLVTKRVIRAAALAHLRPMPGELLWDIGVGAGSVAIEWCRAADGARAIGVERRADRAARAVANAERLTAPGAFELVEGDAVAVVGSLPAPDAVFVGGGGTVEVLEAAMSALRPGGRIVVHGVTVEAELLCVEAQRRWGGQLVRMQVETAEPLGRLTGWKPARTVIQWSRQRHPA